MNEEGVSICITAYHVEKYIKDCLDSVVNQTWFNTHNDWEIIVGVDGCEKTLSQLKTIMNNYKNLRVFMMDSNKGTYITSNTIMSNATYENIFRFDGDDIISIKSYIKRQELLSSILSLEFTTFQATNNVPNGITYKFLNPKFNGIKDEGEYVTLEFEWDKYEGGQLLSEKYHSKTAEEKFKNKERRENYAPTIDFSSTIS